MLQVHRGGNLIREGGCRSGFPSDNSRIPDRIFPLFPTDGSEQNAPAGESRTAKRPRREELFFAHT